jgi:prepilin-type N-terminal cleavage/methylation domain-containing protein
MANDALVPRRSERGFSLIEMLVVVFIIAIMAAVALPNIGQYIRNYKVKGAAQEVAGELQSARSRAIVSNTNEGVSFVVLDEDTYRFVQEDLVAPAPERFGGIRTLPSGVIFVVSTLADAGPTVRFNRLGGFCNPASSTGTCDPPVPVSDRFQAGEASLIDSGPHLNYIGAEVATGTMVVRLREMSTQLERTVRIAPGGRVLPQP